jgi:uncharacterized protein
MALPKKLKNFDVFQNGVSWLGLMASVTLPKLQRKMEAYRGGGMAGPVKLDFGQEELEMGFASGGLLRDAIKHYAATTVDRVQLRFAGAYQNEATGICDAVEVACRGRYSEIDFGEAKPGDDTEHKYTMPLTYYKLSINGEAIIEIDMLANIVIVDGRDITFAQRLATGHW